jgi:hypothetical protein
MKTCKKGVTLLEVIIASFILLMIVYAIYDIFTHGLLMWKHGSRKQENEQKAIVVSNRLFYELKLSPASSITTFTCDGLSVNNLNLADKSITLEDDPDANNGISFRSPIDPNTGEIVFDNWMGKLRWQSYNIYYIKPDPVNIKKKIFYRRDLSLGTKKGEVNSMPLELFIPDTGTSTQIIDYIKGNFAGTDLSSERTVCRDVVKALFRRNSYREIEFFLEVGQEGFASNGDNRINIILKN